MRFVGVCQYDGSNYSGFQSKKNSSSIQDHLELAISSVGTLNERINYAGRTDAGVHATRQIFDFSSQDHRETSQWLRASILIYQMILQYRQSKKYQMIFIQDLSVYW